MKFIDNTLIEEALAYPLLIQELGKAFAQMNSVTPQRVHLKYEGRKDSESSTLLLMPSWIPYQNAGLKIATVSPGNGARNLPSVNGIYLLFDVETGQCTHIFDAKIITAKRTAATSALASSFLSRIDSEVMLMVGTGTLAPELIRAHATVRPIKKVFVWGRDFSKAEKVCEDLLPVGISVEPVKNLKDICAKADIISCATLSKEPLLYGAFIREGQHIDLVGSYLPTMREADDEVIKKSKIFIDHSGALKESGDLAIPLVSNLIDMNNVQADLRELCSKSKLGRKNDSEITLFKSVGHALEDLVAARLISMNDSDSQRKN